MNSPRHEADDQAAAWDARLRGARSTTRSHLDFQTWLDESPENRAAHERLQTALKLLRAHADQPEMAALRDEARSGVNYSNRRRLLGGAAVALVIIMFGSRIWMQGGWSSSALMGHGTEYSTAVDEQAKVTLADGSVVTLDAGTKLVVRLTSSRRDISLLAGHALFKVAKDTHRPFVVSAHDRTITALGTLFDVRLYPHGLKVILATGAVAIRSIKSGDGMPAILKPSQRFLENEATGTSNIDSVDADKAISWADGRLFFDNDTLDAVATEMNQYSPRHKLVIDPSVANIKINGMFHTNDLPSFAEALEATLPVQAHLEDDGRIVISRRRNDIEDLRDQNSLK